MGIGGDTVTLWLRARRVTGPMNIIERAQAFVEHMVGLRTKDAEAWRKCPRCGKSNTCCWGSYPRRPQTLKGPQEIRVPRHYCKDCRRTYSEESPPVGRGRWYGREVQRAAMDHWQHGGMSLRRAAETVRSCPGPPKKREPNTESSSVDGASPPSFGAT